MPSADHPWLLFLATTASLTVAFPLARFFFDDYETFRAEFGFERDWERQLWLLGFLPTSPMIYVRVMGFLGCLAVVFMAVYSLGLRIAAPE